MVYPILAREVSVFRHLLAAYTYLLLSCRSVYAFQLSKTKRADLLDHKVDATADSIMRQIAWKLNKRSATSYNTHVSSNKTY